MNIDTYSSTFLTWKKVKMLLSDNFVLKWTTDRESVRTKPRSIAKRLERKMGPNVEILIRIYFSCWLLLCTSMICLFVFLMRNIQKKFIKKTMFQKE